jgi:pimeloyl-ACP methyl ester carboxylesterase
LANGAGSGQEQPVTSRLRTINGWSVNDSGPRAADHVVLLLAGALCTAAFYDDLAAQPALGSVRLVAATLPGFGGTAPLPDCSIESYAAGAGGIAADIGADAVVGHSVGANVAIEMAAAANAPLPMLLLAPSFSRADETKSVRVINALGRVLGAGLFSLVVKSTDSTMQGAFPEERHAALVAEMRKNDPQFVRRQLREYLGYLGRHGSVVDRLCESRAPAWVVFGEDDNIGITARERRTIEGCATTKLVEVSDAGHFTMVQQPGRVAELLLDVLSAAASEDTATGGGPSEDLA